MHQHIVFEKNLNFSLFFKKKKWAHSDDFFFFNFRLSSKFQDTASGRILYKKLLLSIGVNIPPPTLPLSDPKDQLSEKLQIEEQGQPALPER